VYSLQSAVTAWVLDIVSGVGTHGKNLDGQVGGICARPSASNNGVQHSLNFSDEEMSCWGGNALN